MRAPPAEPELSSRRAAWSRRIRAYALGDRPTSARNDAISRLVDMPTRSRISAIRMDGLSSIAAIAAATPGCRYRRPRSRQQEFLHDAESSRRRGRFDQTLVQLKPVVAPDVIEAHVRILQVAQRDSEER